MAALQLGNSTIILKWLMMLEYKNCDVLQWFDRIIHLIL